jgi:hypothetical protein
MVTVNVTVVWKVTGVTVCDSRVTRLVSQFGVWSVDLTVDMTIASMCWWQFWSVGVSVLLHHVLMVLCVLVATCSCYRIDVLMAVLTTVLMTVLISWYVDDCDVLRCWCVAVLICWCVDCVDNIVEVSMCREHTFWTVKKMLLGWNFLELDGYTVFSTVLSFWKGLLIGNGVTQPFADNVYNSLYPFYYGHGLISLQTSELLRFCAGGTNINGTCDQKLWIAEIPLPK